MLTGDGYDVVGVTVGGPPPLGRVALQLHPGVTALYGQNGSGKSRLLRAIAEAAGADLAHAGPQFQQRELLVRLAEDPDQPDDRRGGWPSSVRWALKRALMVAAQERLEETGGDFEARQPLESPPEDLRSLVRSLVDVHLWIDDAPLLSAIAEQGYLAVTSGHRGQTVSPAATFDCLVGTSGELVLWESIGTVDWVTAQFLGLGGELTELHPVLFDWSSLTLDRSLDPGALADLERGEFAACSHREGWSAYPLGVRADLDESPVALAGWGLDPATIRRRTLAALQAAASRVVEAADGDEVVLSDEAASRRDRLETRANELLAMTLLDAPSLRLRIGVPDEWLDAEAPAWEACDRGTGEWIAIEHLSSAQHRWAVLAIELALAEDDDRDRPILVLLDEPEAALHRSAEAHLVTGLKRIATELRDAAVIVATHSPLFLSDLGVRAVHVHRSARGLAVATEVDAALNDEGGQTSTLASLGLRRADLLQLARVAVVVEGAHDEAVFSELARDELAASRAVVLKMLGARNAVAVLDAPLLMSLSDAQVLVVLDHDAGGRLLPTWEAIREACAEGDRATVDRALAALHRIETAEAAWLANLADRAVAIGRIDRLHVMGLSEPDILFYLPSDAFKLSRPWAELDAEWRALPRPGRPAFKDWLRKEHGAAISTDRVRKASATLDVVPPDLDEVIAMVRRLAYLSTDPR